MYVRAAGHPVVGTPVDHPEVQAKHRSLFGGHKHGTSGGQHHKLNLSASRLGQIVIDSTAGGFGFRLGALPAAHLRRLSQLLWVQRHPTV